MAVVMTYLNEQVDGLNGFTDQNDLEPYAKRTNNFVFSVFPSRSTHRCQVKEFKNDWLEIVAWLLKLNTETGATEVFPITQFGSHKWVEVTSYHGPNLRKSQVHW
jgi:hypothetical protein